MAQRPAKVRFPGATWLVAVALLLSGCQQTGIAQIQSNLPSWLGGAPSAPGHPAPPSAVEVPPAAVTVQAQPLPEAPLPVPPPAAQVPAGVQRVALLLPLSGPGADAGQAILNAAEMALFDVGDGNFQLLPEDTGGTPQGAVQAFQDATRQGARLILGPLFATSAQAIAAQAQAAGVRVIAFSNDQAAAQPGVYVLGLAPQAQVARVIGFAESRGMSRFAALVPDNAYGNAIADSLSQAVGTGGQVVRVERYEPGGSDLTDVVKALADYGPRHAALLAQERQLKAQNDEASREALRRLKGVGGIGDVGFDALLLPEGGERLRAIAALLPYYDVDPAQVKMLGLSAWEDPSLGREPALVGAWFTATPPEVFDVFAKRYAQAFGGPPPQIAALGYDATALAATLAKTGDFSDQALTNPDGFAGATGVFRLLSSGQTQRNYAVLEMGGHGFSVISPAPATFAAPTN